MEKWTERANAKINLLLDVIRKRKDGYHEVRMIMQTVDLHDLLTFELLDRPVIEVETDSKFLPTDENNLIYKAARLLFDDAKITGGVRIHLTKRIPIAAGMAGGSADAAATLRGINKLFSLSYDAEKLRVLSVKIGADVPYCIEGGTVLAEGIGEKLTKLPGTVPCYLVVAKPKINVSTKYVYENLHAETLSYHPDADGMEKAILAEDLRGITDRMGNVLETVTQTRHPIIGEIKESLSEAGAMGAMMSGSGPSVFGVFKNREMAQEGLHRLKYLDLEQLLLTVPIGACSV